MKKCHINYFKYNNNEIRFNKGINYILGSNGSGKTTLLKLIQYALGLNNIPFEENSINPLEINFCVDVNRYHFYREFDSNLIIIETDNGSYEINTRSDEFYDFLIDIFKPDCVLSSNRQIIYLLNDIFYSPEIKNKISYSYLTHLMLGIDKKYEKNIQNKIDDLSSNLKEKENSLNLLSNFKIDVLSKIKCLDMDFEEINNIMNSTFNKYKEVHSSDFQMLNKSKQLLSDLKHENEINIENTIEELEYFYSKYKFSKNIYLFDDFKPILFKRNGIESIGERSFNELSVKLILQSNYQITNGIGVLFNDHNNHFDNSINLYINEIIKKISKDLKIQYIEFISNPKNIDDDYIIYQFDRGYLL